MRILNTIVRAGVSATVILFAACTPQGPDLSVAVVYLTMSSEATHQEADASIRVTEMINLQLPLDRGTGYVWSLAAPLGSDSPVGWTSNESEAPGAPEDTVIGGRTWYLVTLVGQHPGNAVVDLKYSRPWEADVPPAKTYRVRVTVSK